VLLLIVALLMVLLLPTVAGVRDRALAITSLSNLRQHVAVFSSYTNENDEQFPYVTDPEATYTILRSGDVVQEARYFEALWFWHLALAEHYYGADYRHKTFYPPKTPPAYFTHYLYSPTFLAAPEYWRAETRVGPSQWRAVRAFEVQYPSGKGLFRDTYVLREGDGGLGVGDGVRVGFVDGSARSVARSELVHPYVRGEGDWWGCVYQGGHYILHTVNGVRGRDVE
jgi:hypothetical protein